jgi:arsenate reductase-like glutaredoxin family protein
MSNEKPVRRVNVDNLSQEQIENIAKQMGDKLAEIINRAAEEARIITKIYGFDIKLAYKLEPLEESNKNS